MKTLILYLSKHKTTEKYATWISEEAQSDLVSIDNASNINLDDYSVIVFGSWVYLDKIKIADYIIDNWKILQTKKIIVFSSAITKPQDPKTKQIFEDSFPKYIRDSIYYFPLPGKLSIDEVNIVEKITLKIRKKYKELDDVDRLLIRPIVVKIYDLKVIG